MKTSSVVFGSSSTIAGWIINSLKELEIDCIPVSRSINDTYSIKADFTNYAEVLEAYKNIFRHSTNISSIYYCAGAQGHSPISQSEPEDWHNVINVNLVGGYNIYRAYVESTSSTENIKFIFLGSTASISKPKNYSSYSISKTALEQLVTYINNEDPKSIRACCLRLGTCQTSFSGALDLPLAIDYFDLEKIIRMIELSRIATFPDLISTRPILK